METVTYKNVKFNVWVSVTLQLYINQCYNVLELVIFIVARINNAVNSWVLAVMVADGCLSEEGVN